MVLISEEEFIKLLKKIMNKELELLRLNFFPYKRRPSLRRPIDVEFKIEKGMSLSTLAYYTNDSSKEKRFKYSHKITVTEVLYDDYNLYCNWSIKLGYGSKIYYGVM